MQRWLLYICQFALGQAFVFHVNWSILFCIFVLTIRNSSYLGPQAINHVALPQLDFPSLSHLRSNYSLSFDRALCWRRSVDQNNAALFMVHCFATLFLSKGYFSLDPFTSARPILFPHFLDPRSEHSATKPMEMTRTWSGLGNLGFLDLGTVGYRLVRRTSGHGIQASLSILLNLEKQYILNSLLHKFPGISGNSLYSHQDWRFPQWKTAWFTKLPSRRF